jgi:16S rRNA (adenine1518-N6/adenine1519-N6)-dimethyltransferase
MKTLARLRGARAFGQHKTVDKGLVRLVAKLATIRPSDKVLEIGTGTGVLTRELAPLAKRVYSYEIDRELASEAKRNLRNEENVEVVLGDAFSTTLHFDVLASFLPYARSYGFIRWLAEQDFRFACVVVQREFAMKLLALPGMREYRPISVLSQLCFEVNRVSVASPRSFYPKPKVLSEVITIRPFALPERERVAMFYPRVSEIFGFRRKTVHSMISHLIRKKFRETLTVDELKKIFGNVNERRIYTLRPREILHLAELIYHAS